MRFEAYAVVAQYPVAFPRIKTACIKWAWRQDTAKGGWCQMPPNIMHRFADDSKYKMGGIMMDAEDAMLALSKFVSTVVEVPKDRTKWIASVGISIMAKIFAVPKTQDGKTVAQQESELRESIAELITQKLLELRGDGGSIRGRGVPDFFSALPKETQLMHMVQERLVNLRGASASNTSVVTEELVPKPIEMDADGKPLTQHETTFAQQPKAVETIPWSTWSEKQATHNDISMAKMIAMLGVGWMHDNAFTDSTPLALVRKGSEIEAKATRTLEIGELMVPLFFKKQSSMHCVGDSGTVHPNAVCVEVSWTTAASDLETEAGMEGNREVKIPVHVQPELKLPAKGTDGLQWSLTSAVHPYWFIKRSKDVDDEANAAFVKQDVTHVMACSFDGTPGDAAPLTPATDTYTVSVPWIVNTKQIRAGEVVIVKGNPKTLKKKAPPPEERNTTAFDQIAKREKKKARPTAN